MSTGEASREILAEAVGWGAILLRRMGENGGYWAEEDDSGRVDPTEQARLCDLAAAALREQETPAASSDALEARMWRRLVARVYAMMDDEPHVQWVRHKIEHIAEHIHEDGWPERSL